MNPQFHLDQDVDKRVKELLNAHYGDPECVKTVAELGLHLASDGQHLLAAGQAGRILVTHNGKDFITMHDAWMAWSSAWDVAPTHAGILIVPQMWRFAQIAREIAAFMGARITLPNEIYAYNPDPSVARWVRDPSPRRR